MRYFCRKTNCHWEINVKDDRIAGTYKYLCPKCETPQKKADMVNEAQMSRSQKAEVEKEALYHCSSCDHPAYSMEELNEFDNCGRCERCQEEYGMIDEEF